MDFPSNTVLKNLPANAGDTGSIPGSGSSLGEGKGYPLQYSCLENPMDSIVHGVVLYLCVMYIGASLVAQW